MTWWQCSSLGAVNIPDTTERSLRNRQKSMSVNTTAPVRNEEHTFNHDGESSHWNKMPSLQLIRSLLQVVFLSKRHALAKYKIHCPCQIHPWMSCQFYPQTLRGFRSSWNWLGTTLVPPPVLPPLAPVYSLRSTSPQPFPRLVDNPCLHAAATT